MTKKMMIRFGDLMLKGKNIKTFTNRINEHIRFKLQTFDVTYDKKHDRLYVIYEAVDEQNIKNKLKTIQGIASFSVVYETTFEEEQIIFKTVKLLKDELSNKQSVRFKIETKRANKTFPLTSQETTLKLAPHILKQADLPLVIDVNNPDVTLVIEIRLEAVYLYLNKQEGLGGFPAHTGDHTLVMLSGGIDSPVAAFLALKQGLVVDLMHFESTPMTALESAQKVIDVSKALSLYTFKENIRCHMVPFTVMHQNILKYVPESYHITIMRRMMFRIAERYALKHGMHGIITGESIGQVASQTMQSMRAVEAVTKLPIIRPLATYNKSDIVNIAKSIDTFDISIRPFEDCCSIYMPKQPATKPRDYIALRYEYLFDYETILEDILANIISIDITPHTQLNIPEHGFTFKEAYTHYIKSKETL